MNKQDGAIELCGHAFQFAHHLRHDRVVVHVAAAAERNERVEYEKVRAQRLESRLENLEAAFVEHRKHFFL